MPKFRKDALEEYLRNAGATTKEQQDELVESLGFDVLPLRDEGQRLEIVRSGETGAQFVRRRGEVSVRPKLLGLRDRVILRPWHNQSLDGLEVDPYGPDQGTTGGGRNDA
jgi:hypothetical protein